MFELGREGGRERGKEGGREGGREGEREGRMKKGGREAGMRKIRDKKKIEHTPIIREFTVYQTSHQKDKDYTIYTKTTFPKKEQEDFEGNLKHEKLLLWWDQTSQHPWAAASGLLALHQQ